MADAPLDLAALRSHLGQALGLLEKLAPNYELGKAHYDGTRAEVSASPLVRKLIESNAEASPITLAHIPVDALVDKIELASITAAEPAAAKLLEVMVDENDLEDEADDWIRKACYFGDYYAIIDPIDEDDDGNATTLRLVGSSPLSTIVVYDRKDGRTALYGVKRWKAEGDRWRALMYYDDVTVKLVTEPRGNTSAAPRAVDYLLDTNDEGEPGTERIPHEGGRMLIAHLPVDGKPYGSPVHRKAWGPQDAITKISATNLSNVDGLGFASRWALADPLAEIDDDVDADFGEDAPTTEVGKGDGLTTATTGKSRVRTVPGAIAILRGVTKVGQFDATGSDDFLKNLDWYLRVMAVACGVPLFEFDLNGEQPSGEARRRAEGRLNKHANKVKRSAAAFFRTLGDTALGVLGVKATVVVNFRPTETSTDKDGIELVASKIAAGVPVTQALLEAGYTDEQVALWYPTGTPHVTPALLTLLATALAALGNAKTLGVITDVELADMLPTILTAARGEGPVEDVDDDPLPGVVVDAATQFRAKSEAVGILIRAGADPVKASIAAGLDGLTFPNVPTTVRIPETEASDLEGAGAAAPSAAPAP